jgi:hypothetical protein
MKKLIECVPNFSEATGYDREKLSCELDSVTNPDPDSYFWFGTE